MTSRVSFPKLIKELTKNHLASFLITVLTFFIHLIYFLMRIQNILQTTWVSDDITELATPENAGFILQEIHELCVPNFGNMLVAMAIGAYLAFDYFRYLHSKKETDFIESLPVRRQEQFQTRLLSSLLIFAVLCTVTLGIELGVVFSTGYGSLYILQNMLWGLLCMFGAFLASWVTVALAMIMTGHSIVAFLGTGVFFCYVPLILNNLIPTYANVFFDTYVYRSPEEMSASYYFSPATLAYKLVVDYHLEGWRISRHWTYMVGICVFAIVIGVIAYFLFLRRPSEAAGRAMAFEKANSPIRFLIVIPLALYLGLFLKEMTSFAEMPWLIFGVVVGAALLHGIMECIFHFDIRALLSKKRQLLLTILLSLTFVGFFWFDVFSYDEYVPKKEAVDYVKLEVSLVGLSTYDDWGATKNCIRGEAIDDVLSLADELIHPRELTDEEMADFSSDNITFVYYLKNGRKAYRSYTFNINDIPEILDRMSGTKEFKDDCSPLYSIDRDNIISVTASNGVSSKVLKLTSEERDELFDTYLEEYTPQTFTEMLMEPALMELNIEFTTTDEHGSPYNYSHYHFIYKSHTKTLKLLQKYNVYPMAQTEGIDFVQLELYDEEYAKEEGPFTITDANVLKELQPFMLPSDFLFHDYGNEYLHCDITVTVNGEPEYLRVSIHEDDLKAYLP